MEAKKHEVESVENRLTKELAAKLDQSQSEIKTLIEMDDFKFQEYVDEQARKINQWKSNTYNALLKQKGNVHEKLTVFLFCFICFCLNYGFGDIF